jgi:pyruvate-formate lyase-activating enzyme/glutaredoxin
MSNAIYTATGCARCKITKSYLKENTIEYEEYDFKAEGKDAFSQFYRANRADIYRDQDGVEFPVFTDGKFIHQGVGVIIGYLVAGDALSGFIGRSRLHGEWIDGFDISSGDAEHTQALLKVLTYLKKSGLKIQVTTNGHNASGLAAVVEKKLADRVIVEVKGPGPLYGKLHGVEIDEDELKQSIALAAKVPEYRYFTTIAPLVRNDGSVSYLSPEEIGEAARLIEAATGSKKHPYELKIVDSKQAPTEQLKTVAPLPPAALFKYRTAARRYMVMTEIQK